MSKPLKPNQVRAHKHKTKGMSFYIVCENTQTKKFTCVWFRRNTEDAMLHGSPDLTYVPSTSDPVIMDNINELTTTFKEIYAEQYVKEVADALVQLELGGQIKIDFDE